MYRKGNELTKCVVRKDLRLQNFGKCRVGKSNRDGKKECRRSEEKSKIGKGIRSILK